MGNCAFMGRAPRAFHRTTSVLEERQRAEGGSQAGGLSKFGGVCQIRGDGVVTGGNGIAAARYETARLGKLLRPLARSARRAVRQDEAEWLKRRSGQDQAVTGSSRTLIASRQTAQRFQESEGTETSGGHRS